jgi:hypothetical protein
VLVDANVKTIPGRHVKYSPTTLAASQVPVAPAVLGAVPSKEALVLSIEHHPLTGVAILI